MTTFLALYSGERVNTSKIIAISADPDLVQRFASEMLVDSDRDALGRAKDDPVLDALEGGRRQALRVIANSNKKAPRLLTEQPGRNQKGLYDSIPQ